MGFLAQRKSDKALARAEAAFVSGDIRSAVAWAVESLGLLRDAGVSDGSLVCGPMNLLPAHSDQADRGFPWARTN